MKSASSYSGFRVSLREFLLVVGAVAVSCAALKYANSWWLAAIASVAMLAFMAAAVIALVDRGPRQAFALGFVAAFGIYILLLFSMREQIGGSGNVRTENPEFDPYTGALPTTLALRPLFKLVVENWYVDIATGNRVRQADLPEGAQINPYYGIGGMGGGMGGMGSGPPQTGFGSVGEAPMRGDFMPIGHCLWALLLGYIGGHFAKFVYARRTGEQAAASPAPR